MARRGVHARRPKARRELRPRGNSPCVERPRRASSCSSSISTPGRLRASAPPPTTSRPRGHRRRRQPRRLADRHRRRGRERADLRHQHRQATPRPAASPLRPPRPVRRPARGVQPGRLEDRNDGMGRDRPHLRRRQRPSAPRVPWARDGRARTYAVEWTRDGKRLLTTGQGATHIWDVRTGRQLLALPTAGDPGISGAWSPDDRQVLTESATGARVWDASTGKLLRTLRTGAPVAELKFSRDGTRLAIGTLTSGRRAQGSGTGPPASSGSSCRRAACEPRSAPTAGSLPACIRNRCPSCTCGRSIRSSCSESHVAASPAR